MVFQRALKDCLLKINPLTIVNRLDLHKTGYYFDFLKDILHCAGFSNIENLTNKIDSLEKAEYHLEVSAIKNCEFVDFKNNKFWDLFGKIKH